MSYVLALDQGTTSSRAVVFDGDGAVVALAQREFPQHFPRPGWVEHDPRDLWTSQEQVAREAMARADLAPRDVAGIGITNQRETTLVWDRGTGDPVYPAIVWQDRRTAAMCERLAADGHADTFARRTGLVLDPYFSGTKLRWILDHVPGARARAGRGELAFGTVDTWLVWNLTRGAVHATDASNASRTLLYDIHAGGWDPELLELLDVPAEVLPEVHASSEVVAEVSGIDALAGVPIAGIAGDQQAALFGQACHRRGMAKNTYGTGCFVVMHTGTTPIVSSNRLLTTVAWRIDDRTEYALEGSIFTGGAVVQWLRDGLGLVEHARDIEPLAASVPDPGGVVLVPAFTGLGAPHWDAHARGLVAGITRGTTSAHLARAALESIAFQSRDVLDAMQRDAGFALEELRVDGGAVANDLLMQIQCDVLGVPVVRPRTVETTALGAAYLAGLATSVWTDRASIARNWAAERRFEPSPAAAALAARRGAWERAVERARGWVQGDAGA